MNDETVILRFTEPSVFMLFPINFSSPANMCPFLHFKPAIHSKKDGTVYV